MEKGCLHSRVQTTGAMLTCKHRYPTASLRYACVPHVALNQCARPCVPAYISLRRDPCESRNSSLVFSQRRRRLRVEQPLIVAMSNPWRSRPTGSTPPSQPGYTPLSQLRFTQDTPPRAVTSGQSSQTRHAQSTTPFTPASPPSISSSRKFVKSYFFTYLQQMVSIYLFDTIHVS